MSAPGILDILVTAFEPSGDALAAGLIAELLRRRPGMKIYALGGPKMAAAGAELIETTTERAVMLGGAVSQAWAHRKRLKRLDRWLREHSIAALVPTDSPAANWAICKLVRRLQPKVKIVHLAAPQVWAWAGWRVHKLRRLTDHVLCLLPFEPAWFAERNVPATFVGHPVFNSPLPLGEGGSRSEPGEGISDNPMSTIARSIVQQQRESPHPSPLPGGEGGRLALLPGSRPGEIAKNWPTMLAAFHKLKITHPKLQASVAAADAAAADQIAQINDRGDSPSPAPRVYVDRTDAIIDWADAVLVVSGTATLQVASHKKPMVALYNVNRWSWNLVGRWIVATRTFTLPNLISEADGRGRVITELVPHFGTIGPVVEEVDRLLCDPAARERQRAALAGVCSHFEGIAFGQRAAEKLLDVVEGLTPSPSEGRGTGRQKKGRSREGTPL